MADIEKFDPNSLMNGVRDRIKATFVSLIPDDKWDELVKREVQNFFEVKKEDRLLKPLGYTDFQRVVIGMLEEKAKEEVKKYLATLDDGYWHNGVRGPSDTLIKLIKEHAPEIFARTMGSMFQNVVNQMGNRY